MAQLKRSATRNTVISIFDTTTLFDDVVDIIDRLHAERDTPLSKRAQRDREIGRGTVARSSQPLAQLREWLRHSRGDAESTGGARAVAVRRGMSLIVALCGLLVGWGVATALFYYDGRHPVNTVSILGVFVGLQLVLLVMLVVAMLPLNRIPILAALQRVLRSFSVGRIAAALSRLLPATMRGEVAVLLDTGGRRTHGWSKVVQWQVFTWSQWFAVLFNVGALLAALHLIVFSDLAFGWSTTLTISTADASAWIDRLAAPWRWWWPGAVPSLELIDATRYYRLNQGLLPGAPAAVDVAQLGQWWPFLVAAMLCYGLLPRLVALWLSYWSFGRALRDVLLTTPDAVALLDRMNTPLVETGAAAVDLDPVTGTASVPAGTTSHALGATVDVVDWAQASGDADRVGSWLKRNGTLLNSYYEAGGAQSLQGDSDVIEALTTPGVTIVLLVRGWEPPLLEFIDFLRELRDTVSEQRTMAVLLVGSSQDLSAPNDPADVEIWTTVLNDKVDSRLRVEDAYRVFAQRHGVEEHISPAAEPPAS
jgi:hypothetical protein